MDTDVTSPPLAPPADDGAGRASVKADAPAAVSRLPLHWLLEGLLIVVSVVLGFSLTELGEYRNERQLASRMIASIRMEVEYNHATLSPFLPIHRRWQEALEREDPARGAGSAVDRLRATRPPLPADVRTNIPLLRRAAWDTALSTGGLRLIDYDLAAGLSEIYSMQAYASATFPRLFLEPVFFDVERRSAAIMVAQTSLQELVWAEQTLLDLYDKHLPVLRASAP